MSLWIYFSEVKLTEVFDANITHNLAPMATEAGIYDILWHPENNGIKYAKQFIEPLVLAITDMKARPDHYMSFDSPNGWGTYKNFLPWLEKVLAAAIEHPNALVEAST